MTGSPFVAAWLHSQDVDAWWGRAHDLGRRAVERELGDAVETLSFAGLGEDRRWWDAAERLATDGVDALVVCDTAVQPMVDELVRRFPGTTVLHSQGTGSGPRLTTFRAARDQHAFVSGMIAGGCTRSGVIGAVEGVRSPHDLVYTNAWALGAARVRPDIRIVSSWVGSYRAPDQHDRERAAVQGLVAAGADVIGGNLTENPAAVVAALQEGAWVSAHDERHVAWPGVLDAAYLDWAPFYVEALRRLCAGERLPVRCYLRAHDGVVRNAVGDVAPPKIAAAALECVRAVVSGGIWPDTLRDEHGVTHELPPGFPPGHTPRWDEMSAREQYLNSPALDWLTDAFVPRAGAGA
ncbi:BMP family ABC transporter substrate-binding protein [Microbacterium sp. No. 7]|uniref:BMP family ABC transporter substrate-binding protein n=1 Tax=Microbacterium sp. No. 7 TaxID=1714373 RepID=UPI0006D2A940|nr:BMP family ABC transporter substrate-binding protein [Microbacterium sp. No. 7]ALJ22274.1 hypothetical protein AOA12_21260 [Microbacterium sp. No. 7]